MKYARFAQHLHALATECSGYETNWSDVAARYATSLKEWPPAFAAGNRREALGHLHFASVCLDIYFSEHGSRLLAAGKHEDGASKMKSGCIARYVRDSVALAIMRTVPTRNVGMTRAKALANIAYARALGPAAIGRDLPRVIDAIDALGGLSSPRSTKARRLVEDLHVAALGDPARLVHADIVGEALGRSFVSGDVDLITVEDGCLGTWPAELLVASAFSDHHLCELSAPAGAATALQPWLHGIDELTRLAPSVCSVPDASELLELASSVVDIPAAEFGAV